MQNIDGMSVDASDASIHASNIAEEENPADISVNIILSRRNTHLLKDLILVQGMSLDDVEADEKYDPKEVATSVMLQDVRVSQYISQLLQC